MPSRLARPLFIAAALAAFAALVATLGWVVITAAVRPLDGVEGDVLFEADRIRAGLPLYTDPVTGASEYGAPPSRYLVLYPPLWSSLLSLVPRGAATIVGRIAGMVSWFGLLAWISARAPFARRRTVALAAAFVAGVWVLALYGGSARPDAVAVLFSGVALERVARRAREASGKPRSPPACDLLAGVLFTLAAWTKPNVIGAAPGALVACFAVARGPLRARASAVLPGLGGVLGTSVIVAGVLHVVSDGAWVAHLLSSTGQPPSSSLWLEQMGKRGPFFLLFLGAAVALGVRSRRDHGAAVATAALVTSTTWCLLSIAKIGSATNYFMEPCVAAVVVLSCVDLPPMHGRARVAVAGVALAQATWNGAASVRGAVADLPRAFERARALEEVRTACSAGADGVILADEPGLELALNGRVIMTPFQSTHLARRGRFPVAAWAEDVTSPRARCLVLQSDLLERPLDEVSVEHDRFAPALRQALAARFELVTKRAGYWIYRARPPA